MKLSRYPICKSHITLDQMVQDDAGKELLAIVAGMGKHSGRAMVNYLGLFRPAKQDLSNSRAVKLAQEALALTQNHQALAMAMDQTVQSIMNKRLNNQGVKPLANHNYLKQVLSSVLEQCTAPTQEQRSNSIEVKTQGVELTNEQNKKAFEEQMKRYSKNFKPHFKGEES
ncbi:hypothetical protein MHM95_06205 [Pseudoalteromonas sp. CnMc7-15]|uniref:hypothetical protein n=1 Tax=unclassified Pseudoalteromonas TaxID=194690 RepID=UPI001EF51484|nr:hypothetical protein [Pseudoalteromonas sp. CnMc7-15]MCG7565879.1 hypothetical protein [Pseudoalteromonas sp. CnMc7-15]